MNIQTLRLDGESPQLDSIYTAAALDASSKEAVTPSAFVRPEKGGTFRYISPHCLKPPNSKAETGSARARN